MFSIHKSEASLRLLRDRAQRRSRRRGGRNYRPRLEPLEARQLLATFTVTNTADTGQGSFRQAILDANSTTGLDVIEFAIPLSLANQDVDGNGTADAFELRPQTPFPNLTDSVEIDAASQAALVGDTNPLGPEIVLDGSDVPVGTAAPGLRVEGVGSRVSGLGIRHFPGAGLVIAGAGSTVVGNYIGTDPRGLQAQGNGQDGLRLLSGMNVVSGNLIGGNAGSGVFVDVQDSNLIVQNAIGRAADGSVTFPNSGDGVTVFGNLNELTGNAIGANRGSGVAIFGSSNRLTGNEIGGSVPTAGDGRALGNSQGGVRVDDGQSNVIGDPQNVSIGLTPGDNLIAFNGGPGVEVSDNLGVNLAVARIQANSIFANAGLGIDLSSISGGDGATPNDFQDADGGPNLLQNHPELDAVVLAGPGSLVQGSLHSIPNTIFAIDFYDNSTDPTGAGDEGMNYLGSSTVVTDGAGNAAIAAPLSVANPGLVITATATDPNGNTSEFSPPARVLGTISGVKFEDANANGVQDASEQLLAGWTIYLDLDNNGVLDPNEPFEITDQTGHYSFQVAPGNYTVAEQLQPGWLPTFPVGGVHSLSVLPAAASFADFGNIQVGAIEVTKFHDLNGDGVFDSAAEPLLGGWEFALTDLSGNALATATTNSSGMATFTDLLPGSYRVVETQQAGWQVTTPTSGESFVAVSSAVTSSLLFGNQLLGAIEGLKWEDLNLDGIQDPGEPLVPGFEVYLDLNFNGQLDSGEPLEVTDGSGHYRFDGLPAQSYQVVEIQQPGWYSTSPGVQTPGTAPSHVVSVRAGAATRADFGNARFARIEGVVFDDLNGNGVRDAGEPGRVGVEVYADANDNAQLDPGEPSAVTVADNLLTPEDEAGTYVLTGLTGGVHTIREVTPNDTIQTAPGMERGGISVTPSTDANALRDLLLGPGITPVGDATLVSGPDSAGFFTGGASSIGIGTGVLLTSGEAPLAEGPNTQSGATGSASLVGDSDLDTEFSLTTLDTTYLEFDFTTAGGDLFFSFVFASEEYNEFVNSQFDDVFAFFVDGTNVALVPGTNTPISVNNVNGGLPLGSNATNPQFFNNNDPAEGGQFVDEIEYDGFTDVFVATAFNLGPGVHTIKLAISDVGDSSLDSAVFLRAGSFSDALPSIPGAHVVRVTSSDQLQSGLDFGNLPTATIDGVKWEDTDGNGFRDPGEPLLPGWSIFIDTNGNGTFDPSEPLTMTDPSGAYSFSGLLPGDYSILEIQQPGYQQTFPQQGFASTDIVPAGLLNNYVVEGDLNGDGAVDLIALADLSRELRVLTNDGTASFTTTASHVFDGRPQSAVVGNFDGDSTPDVAVAVQGYPHVESGDNGVYLFRNPGVTSGSLTPSQRVPVGAGAVHLAAGDFNQDGIADLAVAQFQAGLVSILLNDGRGNFLPGQQLSIADGQPIWLAAEDFNADGRSDLAVADSLGKQLHLFLADSQGTLVPTQSLAVPGLPASVVPLHRPGGTDLAVASFLDDSVLLLSNQGDGTFSPAGSIPVGGRPQGLTTRDINGDQFDDLLVSSESAAATLLVSNGQGGFQSSTVHLVGASRAVALADLNGDGLADVAASNLVHGVQINLQRPAGHQVTVGPGDVLGGIDFGNTPIAQAASGPGAEPPPGLPGDVNADGALTPVDALIVINRLNQGGEGEATSRMDVSGDGQLTPLDVLLIINRLNSAATLEGEVASQPGDGSPALPFWTAPNATRNPADADIETPAAGFADQGDAEIQRQLLDAAYAVWEPSPQAGPMELSDLNLPATPSEDDVEWLFESLLRHSGIFQK